MADRSRSLDVHRRAAVERRRRALAFVRRRGLALGISTAGISAGGIVFARRRST